MIPRFRNARTLNGFSGSSTKARAKFPFAPKSTLDTIATKRAALILAPCWIVRPPLLTRPRMPRRVLLKVIPRAVSARRVLK